MSAFRIVDALGTHCPVPVRLLARAIARAPADTQFRLLADDPLVAIDVPAWCHTQGHELIALTESAGTWMAIVRTTGSPPDPSTERADTPPRTRSATDLADARARPSSGEVHPDAGRL